MRQAGRSLPEYRAMRGEGSILDAIKQPDLAAEITLQPVRRYGVDAAVLYSDIVVPAHAVGFGIDVAPGTGPVCETPLRTAADLDRLRPFEPEVDTPYVLETVEIARRRAAPTCRCCVRRRTVHGGQLPDRGPARAAPTSTPRRLMHTDADAVARVMRAPGAARRGVDQRPARSWRARVPAVRLVGRRAEPRPTTTRSCCRTPPRCSPASRQPSRAAGIHFGIGCDHLLESMHAAGPSVLGLDWRTSITDARRRMGADLVVQGNLDPALVLAGRDIALAGDRRVLADNGGHPGHIFNLGHGVQPEHRSRRARTRSSTSCTERTAR